MPLPPINLIFLGTPDLAVPFLEALTNEPDFKVLAVVTQPDRPVGRKQILTPSPIKELALKKGLPVLQPETLKDETIQNKLANLEADIFIVVAYGLMIPNKILSLPKLGCLNVHPSLLPKYRGPSPIQSAIVNGDKETGISIMILDKGMDTGPILAQEKIVLSDDETQGSLIEKIKLLGPKLLIKTLHDYSAGKIKPVSQDNSQTVVCKMLSRDSGHIDWNRSAIEINRQIRAYQPWPGCWTIWLRDDKEIRLKILKVKLSEIKTSEIPGTVKIIENNLICQTVENSLEILELQPEGRPVMKTNEFIRGYKDIDGSILK